MPNQHAVGYIRVSTEQQVSDGVSLAAQRRRIERYAEANELTLGGVFADEGLTLLIQWINDQLPENIHIGNALRKSVPMYPEIAIREIVANALIHQDLGQTGSGPLIEIFKSRIEITNPGRPLISPDRFLDLPPQSRNERLAALLRRMGICEEAGSGVDRALHAVEVFQLPPPDFSVEDGSTRVTLYAHRTFADMDKAERVRAAYQHAGLRYVSGQTMTNASLRTRLGVDDRNYPQVSMVIRDALKQRLIVPADPMNKAPRHQRYIPYWANPRTSG
jgi:predicted HTH transcriptional regulator